jgi:hypothetical protein
MDASLPAEHLVEGTAGPAPVETYAVSADGQSVIYLSTPTRHGPTGLYRNRIDGSAAAIRLNGAYTVTDFALRNNADFVFFKNSNNKFRARVDGSSTPEVLEGTSLTAISPTGESYIHWIYHWDEYWDDNWYSYIVGMSLYTYSLESGTEPISLHYIRDRDIWNFTSQILHLTHSADAQMILYVIGETSSIWDFGGGSLYSVPTDGSREPVELMSRLESTGEVSKSAISPDNAWAVVRRRLGVYSIPIQGGTPVNLGYLEDFVISPDSSKIFYLMSSNGQREVYSRQIDGSAPAEKLSQLPETNRNVTHFLLSPDGQWIVYRADADTHAVFELYAIPATGGGTRVKLNAPLVDGGNVVGPDASSGAPTPFAISGDSARVSYCADQELDGFYELYSVSIAGGDVFKRSLAGTQTDGAGLWADSKLVYKGLESETDSYGLYVSTILGPIPEIARLQSQPGLTNVLPVLFSVTFDQSVTGLEAGHFANDGTATGVEFSLSQVTSSEYILAFVAAEGDGTLEPRLPFGVVTNSVGHPNADASAVEDAVTLDRTAPIISIEGGNLLHIECPGEYTRPAAEALDERAGSVPITVIADEVDASVPGSYQVVYEAEDGAGNVGQTTLHVTVEDPTPPLIMMAGNSAMLLECGEEFVEPGATAMDACAGAVHVGMNGSVDTSTPGVYPITYTAGDGSGNVATATRLVTVEDTILPEITLSGDAHLRLSCGATYVEPDASAMDTCAGVVNVVMSGSVDTSTPGVYPITYTAGDGSGNVGTATRLVTVEDTISPEITLAGDAYVRLSCGDIYVELGASAMDTCAGVVYVVISGSVDTSMPGEYTITYTAGDGYGNVATATRLVTVEDNISPEITLAGDAYVRLLCGDMYLEAGASALDTCAGDVDVVMSGSVDTSVPGEYPLTYLASDGNGNMATAERRVEVLCGCVLREVNIAYPLEGSIVHVAGEETVLNFRATVDCPEDTAFVQFHLDGAPLGGLVFAPPYSVDVRYGAAAAEGTPHTLRASATDAAGGVFTSESVFTVASASILDNGLPARPLGEILTEDGDSFYSEVDIKLNCLRRVGMVAWHSGVPGDTPTVELAGDDGTFVRVEAPRTLLAPEELAVLLVALGCESMETALNEQHELVDLRPGMLLTPYVYVAVLRSTDHGETYADMEKDRIATEPLVLRITGPHATAALRPTLYAHPAATLFAPMAFTGVSGVWEAQETAVMDRSINARLEGAGLLGVFNVDPLGPEIRVWPSADFDLIVGLVPVGSTQDTPITVENMGTGILEGTVTIEGSDAFSLAGTTEYRLGTGQRTLPESLTLRFSPTLPGDYATVLHFTGNGDSERTSAQLVVKATATRDKPSSLFGCGSSDAVPRHWGDVGLALLLAAFLLRWHWLQRGKP